VEKKKAGDTLAGSLVAMALAGQKDPDAAAAKGTQHMKNAAALFGGSDAQTFVRRLRHALGKSKNMWLVGHFQSSAAATAAAQKDVRSQASRRR